MKYSKHSIVTAMASIGFGMMALSGCSADYSNAPTIAEPVVQADSIDDNNPDVVDGFDVQESRNVGAWGGVYMSREELIGPRVNIVDVNSVPTIAQDPDLQKWETKFEGTNGFVTTNGEKLYHDSCAACHMHKGEGAMGAGYYPPLANNSKMESKYYVIDILINGFRGMPSFHRMLNDEQMAAVTQYIRSDLNGYKDSVTAADVAQLRHDNPPGTDPSDE